jgi:uncharacterized protein YjbI with pentapeptide repeats
VINGQYFFTAQRLREHREWMRSRPEGSGRLVIEGADLRGAQLAGLTLVGARFDRCDFGGADFAGAWLGEAECYQCVFDHAELAGANLNCAVLSQCSFRGANLTDADVSSTELRNCAFRNACLVGVSFVKSDFWTAVDLSGARLDGAKLIKAALFDCDLRGASLFAVRADYAQFHHVDFRNAQIDAFELDGTSFIDCGVHGVEGMPFVFGQYRAEKPDFSADFDGTDIRPAEHLYALWGQPAT